MICIVSLLVSSVSFSKFQKFELDSKSDRPSGRIFHFEGPDDFLVRNKLMDDPLGLKDHFSLRIGCFELVAADILNVSRPHVSKLLEEGIISFRKVGTHQRILLEDLLLYVNKQKETYKERLQFLAQQAQELKLGYE